MLLAEALTLAAGAVPGADAGAAAVDVELAMLRQVRATRMPMRFPCLPQALWPLSGGGCVRQAGFEAAMRLCEHWSAAGVCLCCAEATLSHALADAC